MRNPRRRILEPLLPHRRVPHRHRRRLRQARRRRPHQRHPRPHHGQVGHLVAPLLGPLVELLVLPVLAHALALGEHAGPGDADLLQAEVADIDALLPDLGPEVTDLHAGHGPEALIPQLHHEHVHPVLLPFDDQLGVDHRVGGAHHAGRPILHGGEGGGVQDEGLRVLVVGGGGLQPPHIAPVPQLRLGIAPSDLTHDGLR
mmetsp:Transcript_18207/g.43880  ORF Transcript_18207/g.43880 Transcript_18207/m.43880 type:complete len:201 (+) Transcript_18207:1271-1873(+)